MRIDGAGAGPQWPERTRAAGKPTATERAHQPEAHEPNGPPPKSTETPPAHGVRNLIASGHFDVTSRAYEVLSERFGVEITPPPVDEAPPIDEAPPLVEDPPIDEAPPVVEEPPLVEAPPIDDAPVIEDPAPIIEPIVDTNLTDELIDALVDGAVEEPAA